MPLLPFLALVALIVELCACSTDPKKQAAIDELERRHATWAETMGGGGM